MSFLLRRAIQQSLAAGPDISTLFSIDLWNGNGTSQSIVNGHDYTADNWLTWIKGRTFARAHFLFDTPRLATNYLNSNSVNGEATEAQSLTSFNNDGYSVGSSVFCNQSGGGFVGWSFRKAARFFDVIKYTGDGVAGREITHNLGVQAGMVVVKSLSAIENWAVQHNSIGGTGVLLLNGTNASINSSAYWNDTDATDSNVTLGSIDNVNQLNDQYIMYVFAHDTADDGVIQCGSYIGNGSGTGPSINLGWKPQYVLIKPATVALGWSMWDTARGINNAGNDQYLEAQSTNAEATSSGIALTSIGFDVEWANSTINANSQTYIYMAIREEI
jgi:hypothetical protein